MPSRDELTEELQHGWDLGLGAVLYKTRYDAHEDRRDLWHVSSRFVDVDSGTRIYELWDATHTRRYYYTAENILEDFDPAGVTVSTAYKPINVFPKEQIDRDFDDYFSPA